MRILLAQLNPTIGDFQGNGKKILSSIAEGREKGADLLLFPELALSGYPPEDLLLLPDFISANMKLLKHIIAASQEIALVVGTIRPNPSKGEKPLHNSAALIQNGKLLRFVDKRLLPTYDVFDERRYFEPGGFSAIWELQGERMAITICEDLWTRSDRIVMADYPCDPIEELLPERPTLLLNLSASPYSYKKLNHREEVISRAARRLGVPALLCNQVGGNDSLIFDGNSLVMNSHGKRVFKGSSFQEEMTLIDTKALPHQPIPSSDPLEELWKALVCGIRDYFQKSGFQRALIGMSGGIDSALVATLAVDALGANGILGVAMPSRYSSQDSLEDAKRLAANLKIDLWTLSIEPPFQAYEELLAPLFQGWAPDVTEENIQARIRGMILMAISNKMGHILLSTGNKSEMAMGYATLYGDMAGGLGVLSDLSKSRVYALAHHANRYEERIPKAILLKEPSAELRAGQRDRDTLPEYAIIDGVLDGYVENHLSPEEIAASLQVDRALVDDLISRIHRNEYKRRQAPPGLRVTEKAFSVGRRFPIVQGWH